MSTEDSSALKANQESFLGASIIFKRENPEAVVYFEEKLKRSGDDRN